MRWGGTTSSEGLGKDHSPSSAHRCSSPRDWRGGKLRMEWGKKASVKRAQDKEGKAVIRGKATACRREVTGGGRCRKRAGA